jgi:hypothetical protein
MRRVLVLAVVVACSHDRGPYDYASSPGAAIYRDKCQVCHGETGEGGLGPRLRDETKSSDQLASIIAQTMPQNAPGQCTGDCATQTASFIHDGLTTSALRCDRVQPTTPRRLRLLTRREYRATARDLFGDEAPAMTCARATDCVFRDYCTYGACEASPCDTQTFVFDPHGAAHAKVHVAGDFNQWAATIAAGGLPLQLDTATGLWSGTFAVGAGNHQYKLVLDEQTWITDPRAPSSAPDGFGGQNGLFALACSGAMAATTDPTAAFPVESRKAGFPFDTDADAALVTDAHVDAFVDAAGKLADFAAPKLTCDWQNARAACLAAIGKKIFRRPLADAEVTRYAALADLPTALHALLVSPAFLYRSELGAKDGGGWKLTPYEIATALAYTFWGTTPDDALYAAADSGALGTPAGIEAQARRLVADPRARAQLGEFVLQWVGGQDVLAAAKRADLFPDFDAARASLADETRAFAQTAVFDRAGTFDELLTAKYTVVDPIAASFYGFPGSGVVDYPDDKRAGVLGHASVLATTAHSDQTSPVERGLLVRRNFLCQELPPPPPNGGAIPPVDPNATTRDRFAMHSTSPACAGCHRYIDPPGFGLERFDPVGRWRDTENGKPIDPTGDMNDVERLGTGTSAHFTSLPDLARAIVASDAAKSCFARQYLRFSRGLRETLAERCGRLSLEQQFEAANRDVRELMVRSVLVPDFVRRR